MKNSACAFSTILMVISYIKNDMRYVRPAFFVYFLHEILRFNFIDLKDFQDDSQFLVLGNFAIHFVFILESTMFFMVYSDQDSIFYNISGKILLLSFCIFTSKIFLFYDGELHYD